MANNTMETSTSELQQSEMNQLKRKSLDGSPTPERGSHVDAPNKRPKVDDIPGHNSDFEDITAENGSIVNKTGDERQGDSSANDIGTVGESLSPDSRQPADVATNSPSPRQERRISESRRRDNSPHTRSPNQERRTDDSRTRDPSPYSRDRRDSGTSRRLSGTSHFHGDNDRTRRPVVSKEEERKRGKRLFGGLLSTLSQTTSNSQQKRRQEIEKRQHEKVAKQKAEDDIRRNERLSKLSTVRKIEQVRFDEQVMRTRHSNMLATARGLQTRSEPKLYYRPWELNKEQEDTIKDQLRDVQVQIEDELQQFKRDKEQRLRELGALPSSSEADALGSEPVESDRSRDAAQAESAATATNDRKRSPVPIPVTEDKDHDEMVEAEEDTVIY